MDQKYIMHTADALVKAATRLPGSKLAILGVVCLCEEGIPSVKDAFSAFEGLPDEHPLKKQFDPEQVHAGYKALKLSDFDYDNNNYYQLLQRLPPQIFFGNAEH